MIQYAPRLGRRFSRIALTPLMVVSLMVRMRKTQAQTLRGITSALNLRSAAGFWIYVRSLFSFINFGVDYTIMCARGPSEITRQMDELTIQGQEHLVAALATERPILVVIMHMGDFQLGFLRMVDLLRPNRHLAVFKLSERNHNEDVLHEALATLGYEHTVMRARDGGGRQAYLALRKGHIVAITIDLELNVTSRSVVQFFGRPCHMQNGPATIAALTRSVIMPVVTFSDKAGRRVVRAGAPIYANPPQAGQDMPATIQKLTQQVATCLEEWIRIYPGQVHAWSAIAESMAHPVPTLVPAEEKQLMSQHA